jgi:hypothetical protein
LIGFPQKIHTLGLGLSFVCVVGLFEEGIASRHIFLEAHIDGANELLYVKIGELSQFIARFDVVAEEYRIVGRDIVLLPVFVAPVEEDNEVRRGGYAQVEELDDLQMAQIIILLDGLANILSYDAHLDVVLDQLQ